MTDNIKMPPMQQALEPDLEDHEYELWGQNVRADFVTVEKAIDYAREAVRLNARADVKLLNAENDRLMKLVIELRAEAVRLQAQGVPDTREMFNAGWCAAARFCDREDVVYDGLVGSGGCPAFEEAYRAAFTGVSAAPQPAQPLDLGVMELAESVGLIGPASRTEDLHEAIQRFHDLIVVNASIKAARHFADGLAQQPLTDEQLYGMHRLNLRIRSGTRNRSQE